MLIFSVSFFRNILCFGLIFTISSLVSAQSQKSFSKFQAGDKLIYEVIRPKDRGNYEFEFLEVKDDQSVGLVSHGGKFMIFEGPKHGYLGKEFAISLGPVETEWSPPVKLFDEGLKVGDQFKQRTSIKLSNGIRLVEVLESQVVGHEKVQVLAGEFDSTRIETVGGIEGRDASGSPFKGTLNMSVWYGVANGRLVMLKRTYSNSFRDKFSQELLEPPVRGK
jgi:hypothetical protein